MSIVIVNNLDLDGVRVGIGKGSGTIMEKIVVRKHKTQSSCVNKHFEKQFCATPKEMNVILYCLFHMADS